MIQAVATTKFSPDMRRDMVKSVVLKIPMGEKTLSILCDFQDLDGRELSSSHHFDSRFKLNVSEVRIFTEGERANQSVLLDNEDVERLVKAISANLTTMNRR